jgi:hypothetical protein
MAGIVCAGERIRRPLVKVARKSPRFNRILTEIHGVSGEYLPYPVLSIGIYQKAL